MRTILTRIATLGVAGVIAFGTLASASAATRHKHRAAHPAQQEMVGQDVQLAPRGTTAVPSAAWQGPYGCVEDEGYGRYTSCDQSGAQ